MASVTTTDDRLGGDVFDINWIASYADKNVGNAKAVSVTGVSLSDPSGATSVDAANYTLVTTGSTTANIVCNTVHTGRASTNSTASADAWRRVCTDP